MQVICYYHPDNTPSVATFGSGTFRPGQTLRCASRYLADWVPEGQKRGCNLNMHIDRINQSNKSVKRESLAQHKRGLPVLWGTNLITKYPNLGHSIDRSSSVSICTRPPD